MSISTGYVNVAISGCSCTDDELTMVPGLTIKGTLTSYILAESRVAVAGRCSTRWKMSFRE